MPVIPANKSGNLRGIEPLEEPLLSLPALERQGLSEVSDEGFGLISATVAFIHNNISLQSYQQLHLLAG